jgi:hypothetical protein
MTVSSLSGLSPSLLLFNPASGPGKNNLRTEADFIAAKETFWKESCIIGKTQPKLLKTSRSEESWCSLPKRSASPLLPKEPLPAKKLFFVWHFRILSIFSIVSLLF